MWVGVDRGSEPHLKNHKNIAFLSNTGSDPIKFAKLPSQHSMLGHHWQAREMPFKWRFAGWPMMAALSLILVLSPFSKKKISEMDPCLFVCLI